MTTPQKYQKRPVTIEAMQITGSAGNIHNTVIPWMIDNGYPWLLGNALEPDTLRPEGQTIEDPVPDRGIYIDPADGALMVRTLEGDMRATTGDYIIKGIKGEFYPCKPDVFAGSYQHPDTGGDEYHTLQELYDYRAVYNALLFNEWYMQDKHDVHKSWKHSDGEPCFGGGWFVVVATTRWGQVTNHYPADKWGMFNIPERDTAATYDGHTPDVALRRLTDTVLDGC